MRIVSSLDAMACSAASAVLRTGLYLAGRTVHVDDFPWLDGPMGTDAQIGLAFYSSFAERAGLRIEPSQGAGLLQDFDALRSDVFDPDLIQSEIKHFYEHTAAYDLEVEAELSITTRAFLWALTRFVSRQMDQFNFPISDRDLSAGMTSSIIPLVAANGERSYTGWLRQAVESERVIYCGLYRTATIPGLTGPCINVTFPLPNGSADVFLAPKADSDGSLRLVSQGAEFGGAGCYRSIDKAGGRRRVRHLRSLHEFFHVTFDDGQLATEHQIRFMGQQVLTLNYRMHRK